MKDNFWLFIGLIIAAVFGAILFTITKDDHHVGVPVVRVVPAEPIVYTEPVKPVEPVKAPEKVEEPKVVPDCQK